MALALHGAAALIGGETSEVKTPRLVSFSSGLLIEHTSIEWGNTVYCNINPSSGGCWSLFRRNILIHIKIALITSGYGRHLSIVAFPW